MNTLSESVLKRFITISFKKQGFTPNHGRLLFPTNPSKDQLRQLHSLAVLTKIERARASLEKKEKALLNYIADGSEVIPEKISPKLVEVRPGTEEELLFRYATLHWSIPVSSGYGRRLRFLILDSFNGKLIGLFGLSDPVFALRDRDKWIGWDQETKRDHLYYVMDAYVLGAVLPYSKLLCGKLIALLTLSNEVRQAFRQKYRGNTSLITGRQRKPHLVLLTTTSALGRSSIYNRLKLGNQRFFQNVGFTQGWGEFHFSNGVYEHILHYVQSHCKPTAKTASWGNGFRNKREVVRKCLGELGKSLDFMNHGVKREIFVAPLAQNTKGFLCGQEKRPRYFDLPAKVLIDSFKNRWLIPRSQRDTSYLSFRKEDWSLWNHSEERMRNSNG
jgi:hypothetical protein